MDHLLIVAFLAGHAAHVLAFRRGEWDSHAKRIIAGAGLLGLASAAALHAAAPADGWLTCLGAATRLAVVATAGVLVSMLVYRTLFHPLCRYPGPFAARLSSGYISYISRRFRLHDELERLHKEHGDIVRIGPSTISIRKPEAVQAVHGPRSKCYKGPWYEQGRPLVSLSNIRDMTEYSHERRIWDHGLNAAALRKYHPIITKTTRQLLQRIEGSRGRLDASKWFNYFSFDVMGWMAFDRPFDVLSSGEPTYWMNLISKNLDLIGVLAHVPWVFLLLKETPIFKATVNTFRAWMRKQVTVQMGRLPETSRSLFASILKHYPPDEQLTEKQRLQLEGDMFLILIAGSDTIAMTLQALFYELCINPDAQRKLQQEIDKYIAEHGGGGNGGEDGEDGEEVGSPDLVNLAGLDHLQACINEALRLWPPVSCGMQRVTPPEGLQVGDERLPGDILLQAPTYLVHRNEAAFPSPNEFIPERWTTKPALIVDRSAFFPFSTGRHVCPGKQFALAEVRHATVEILRRYTVSLAPGFTREDFEAGLRDHFTMEASKLDLAFEPR